MSWVAQPPSRLKIKTPKKSKEKVMRSCGRRKKDQKAKHHTREKHHHHTYQTETWTLGPHGCSWESLKNQHTYLKKEEEESLPTPTISSGSLPLNIALGQALTQPHNTQHR